MGFHAYSLEIVVSTDSLGSLLSGVSSSIAFVWLVLGFFLQRSSFEMELRLLNAQTASLRLQQEELKGINSTNLQNSFFNLITHTQTAMVSDARSILMIYFDDKNRQSMKHLDDKYTSGSHISYLAFMNTDEKFQEWLASDISLKSVIVPDLMKTFCQRWQAVSDFAGNNPEVLARYALLVEASEYAQLARAFQRSLLDITPSRAFE